MLSCIHINILFLFPTEPFYYHLFTSSKDSHSLSHLISFPFYSFPKNVIFRDQEELCFSQKCNLSLFCAVCVFRCKKEERKCKSLSISVTVCFLFPNPKPNKCFIAKHKHELMTTTLLSDFSSYFSTPFN